MQSPVLEILATVNMKVMDRLWAVSAVAMVISLHTTRSRFSIMF